MMLSPVSSPNSPHCHKVDKVERIPIGSLSSEDALDLLITGLQQMISLVPTDVESWVQAYILSGHHDLMVGRSQVPTAPPSPPLDVPDDSTKYANFTDSVSDARKQSLVSTDYSESVSSSAVDSTSSVSGSSYSSPASSPLSSVASSCPSVQPPTDRMSQQSIISRRFWSKTAPDIDIQKYLKRVHQYCPNSTAVYLATSLYIYRLCIERHLIPLTKLNVHRLVIAGLRVACKSLEDVNYPQRRFAKVGGLSEPELSRLEIGFLFLLDFDLKVDLDVLEAQAAYLNRLATVQ
ncbi:cyclin-domain-containing protein [Dipodascopsis uninucleata]